MRFADPDILMALWLIPLVALLIAFAARRRSQRVREFADPLLLERLVPDLSQGRRLAREALRLLAVACLILALARPQFGQRLSVLQREGIDVVVAIDTSASMLAVDAGPESNRLDAARRMVAGLTESLRGDRLGLVVFAGQAFVQCPMTLDYKAARMLLSAVGSETVPQPGTAIGAAIDRALDALGDGERSAAIVLCTDGEDHETDPIAAAKRAAERGARIYPVGFGAARGELIPVSNQSGQRVGYKRDKSGELVVSRLDEATLRRIADITGGRYIRARGGGEIEELRGELDALEKRQIEGGFHSHYEDRFHIFAVAAFALLLMSRLVGERRFGLRARIAGAMVLAVAAGLGAQPAAAASFEEDVARGNAALDAGDVETAVEHYLDAVGKEPDRPEVHYNLGNALYEGGAYEQALGAYAQATSSADSTLAEPLSYNLGNALFRAGRYAEAAEAFKAALKLDPGDEDAKWNLEVALRRMAEQESEGGENGEDGEEQEDGQEQQNEQRNDEQGESENQEDRQQDGEQSEDEEQQESSEGQEDGEEGDQQQQSPEDEAEGGAEDEPQPAPGDEAAQDEAGQAQASPPPEGMTPEEARRWLEALSGDELELLKERFRSQRRRIDVDKDW